MPGNFFFYSERLFQFTKKITSSALQFLLKMKGIQFDKKKDPGEKSGSILLFFLGSHCILSNRFDQSLLFEWLIEGITLQITLWIDFLDDLILLHIFDTDETDTDIGFLGFLKHALDEGILRLIRIDVTRIVTVDLDLRDIEFLESFKGEIASCITVTDELDTEIRQVEDEFLHIGVVIVDILFRDFESEEIIRHMGLVDEVLDLARQGRIAQEGRIRVDGKSFKAIALEDRSTILDIQGRDIVEQGRRDQIDLAIFGSDLDQSIGIEDDLSIFVGKTEKQFGTEDFLRRCFQ